MSGTNRNSVEPELRTPVQYLKGVGPQRAELLQRLDIRTALDVLFFLPRDYQDLQAVVEIAQLQDGQAASVVGVVDEVELRQTGPGRSMLGVLIRDEGQYLRALWFNQPFMERKFAQGRRLLISGTPKRSGLRWEMHHPRVEFLGEEEAAPQGRVLPVYRLTDGISQSQMRRIVHGVVESHAALIEEVLPASLLADCELLPIQAALQQIHAPDGTERLEQARRRFILQEFLVLQLALAMRKYRLTRSRNAPSLAPTAKIDARILRLFPFAPTIDQQRAIQEIGADMARDFPMNRLLQGDVGSGKTLVAEYALLLAVAHGYQAALMAPTEILARQHYDTLGKDLAQSRVRMGLMVGSQTAGQRRETWRSVEQGEIDLLIGTHAIANSMEHAAESDEGGFARLGLVIIDEQHKFGVRQRAAMKREGWEPHYLVMTATPIPRTVTMALFGDLDVSMLRENPPGRQLVHTYVGEESQRDKWWSFFRKKLGEGRQGYVVSPLVEEDARDEVASVERVYESLTNGELEAFRLGMIHGRLPAGDKERVMAEFRDGHLQVLVASSVVEVGVNVPNATVMTIENAERFGLAQLHQLRGRIARGRHPGYVCVFGGLDSEVSDTRLQAFAETSDGFELSEVDFRLRGPGDLFGTKQHGLPPFRIANLLEHQDLLEEARGVARSLVESDPELSAPAYEKLKRMVIGRYGHSLQLGDVG